MWLGEEHSRVEQTGKQGRADREAREDQFRRQRLLSFARVAAMVKNS